MAMPGRLGWPPQALLGFPCRDLAKRTIEAAAALLGPGHEALMLTVWHPVDIGFLPDAGIAMNTADPLIVREAAEQAQRPERRSPRMPVSRPQARRWRRRMR